MPFRLTALLPVTATVQYYRIDVHFSYASFGQRIVLQRI